MPKASTEKQMRVDENLLSTMPWTCTNFGKHSEIDVYVKESGVWETVAQVRGIEGLDAEDIAEFIVEAVSSNSSRKKVGREGVYKGNGRGAVTK